MRTLINCRRIGFTLVELLVVISIITVLAALLVPAVFFAIQKAKTARMGVELANVSKALERYNLEYGEYPPDFSELAEFAGNPTARAELAVAIINDHLQRIFRNRDMTQDRPRNANGAIDISVLAELNPTNAVYFWLKGFSPDPAMPLFGSGVRQPFFEFDESRLTLPIAAYRYEPPAPTPVEMRMASAYYPQGSLDSIPYIYYRANTVSQLNFTASGTNWPITFNGELAQRLAMGPTNLAPSLSEPYRTYASAALWAVISNTDGNYGQSYSVPLPYFSFSGPLIQAQRDNPASGVRGPGNIPLLLPYAEPKRFQLISAGLDGNFGFGGVLWNDPVRMMQVGQGNARTHIYNPADNKNLTNFSGGNTLEDLKEE